MKVNSFLRLLLLIVLASCSKQPTIQTATPDPRLIVQNPQTLLLQIEDLPAGSTYYIPGDSSAPGKAAYPNAYMLEKLGEKTGSALLSDTGRVTGWQVIYQRYNANDPGLEQFVNVVSLFQTRQGAQVFVTRYNPVALKMSGWEMIENQPQVGDVSLVMKSASTNFNAPTIVRYRVVFAYKNAAVTLAISDLEGRVTAADVLNYGRVILKKLQAARLGTQAELAALPAQVETTPEIPTPLVHAPASKAQPLATATLRAELPTPAPTYIGIELPPVTPVNIARHPAALNFGRGVLDAVPHYDANKDPYWQVDLRSYRLDKLDLIRSLSDLLYADFDSKTLWPASLPQGFNPSQIMELGKDPGLSVRALHAQGITGQGVAIAIIDQTLLVDHVEYAGRVKLYEEDENITGVWETARMHGAAVASIAVGKTVGVAPGAELYFIANSLCWDGSEDVSESDYACLARSIRRVLEINRGLPDGHKIRALSISLGWNGSSKGREDVEKAVMEAKNAGLAVFCMNSGDLLGYSFMGLGRDPYADPNQFSSYEPGIFWSKEFSINGLRPNLLLVPMDSRGVASPTGTQDYVFYRAGGLSWTAPYLAGMYALAAQVKPGITPDEFWKLALQTGRTIPVQGKQLGVILDPVALIRALK